MSHASGIVASADLIQKFADLTHGGGARLIQVMIEREAELVVKRTVNPKSDWESDFDLTSTVVTDKDACFILFRTDLQNPQGDYLWYLLRYVPDKAKVRDKMLYASTVATLKQELGSGLFAEDIFGTVVNDINAAGYRAFSSHKDADVPLTEEEKQKKEERLDGVFTGGTGTSGAYVHGVTFPVDDDVIECLQDFKAGNINYIQLDIDMQKERIVLADAQTVEVGRVGALFPKDLPRFHYYRWDHDNDGQSVSSVVFAYSCPDGSFGTQSAPVKHRMLFSSSKANVAGILEGQGIHIDAKLEINAGAEFTEAELNTVLHPAKAEAKKVIAKPKPPVQRKLIRGANQ